MELVLLLDIGSTYTKARVFDIKKQKLIASAQSLTTVWNDVNIGIRKTMRKLSARGIDLDDIKKSLACSSAAGGLKLVVIGLIPNLTAEAARRAALGAGAKVTGTYSFQLNKLEIKKIIDQNPDLIVLSGGTDGGNSRVILKNAELLAESNLNVPIIIAGNQKVAEKVKNILSDGQKEVYVTQNVMAELEKLNVDPLRKTIRKVFLEKIIFAKGLNKTKKYIDHLIMPTPAAVMKAADVIASVMREKYKEIMMIDIGGATTDVYSLSSGEPKQRNVSMKGLEEPYLKRTVEGDLGMRYSAESLLESAGKKELQKYFDLKDEDEIDKYIKKVKVDIRYIAKNKREQKFDAAIASYAAKKAVQRHSGNIEKIYGPFGEALMQTGKDLTEVDLIIGTGGVLKYHQEADEILSHCFFDKSRPDILAPVSPEIIIDRNYLLSSIGLMADYYPDLAKKIAQKYFNFNGGQKNESIK